MTEKKGEDDHMTVAAVDFGRHGMAYCVGDVSRYPPKILELKLSDDVGEINTAKRASLVSCDLFLNMTRVDTYLLEVQPAINRATCMLEAAFSAAVKFGSENNSQVIHVPVIDVKREFELPNGYAQKKRRAEMIACKLLADSSQTRLASKSVSDSFCGSKRRHDMSDALLMVMWYARKKHGRLTNAQVIHPGDKKKRRKVTPRSKKSRK